MLTMVLLAERDARRLHEGRRDNAGQAYVVHLERVAAIKDGPHMLAERYRPAREILDRALA